MEKKYTAEIASVPSLVEDAIRMLKERGINEKLLAEYRLLLEEIGTKMVAAARPGAQFSLRMTRRTGVYNLKISCAGTPVVLGQEDENDIGGRILEEYADCLGQSYSTGVNTVTFSTSTPSDTALVKCCLSVLGATVLGVVFLLTMSAESIAWINRNVLESFVLVFSNFMSTIALPVAFFSLVSFIICLQMSIDRDHRFLRLSGGYVLSSVVAFAIGTLVAILFSGSGLASELSSFRTADVNFMGNDLSGFIRNSVGSNIIEPFTLQNPLPMLILAAVLGLAGANYFGPGGDRVRQSLNNINGVFCKMLDLLYTTIPFFLFMAFLAGWLTDGFYFARTLLFGLILILVPSVLILVFYAVQLWCSGIRVRDFVRDYGDVLRENFKIGSNIQALPYNKRMLYRRTRVSGTFLYDGLKLGTVMNMDGNCLMISTFIMILVRECGITLSLGEYLSIFLVLLLLSLGAPNQPGSFLLVMIVLMDYVGISTAMYGYILIIEALTGKLYSFINSLGDIVTMVIEVRRIKKAEAQGR